MAFIELSNIKRIYRLDGVDIFALRGISLNVEKGAFISIMGPSGSGKTTLMNIIGCLDRPTEGKYILDGIDILTLNDDELSRIRNKRIGFIFQNFNLLPRSTVLENIELPLHYSRLSPSDKKLRCEQIIEKMKLQDLIGRYPNQLSGGQQQKVAIARALVNNPDIILADEPTGNLDSRSGAEIMELITSLNSEGITVLLVTHEKEIAAYAKKIIHFRDGSIVEIHS